MLRARGRRVLVDSPTLLDEIENGYATEASIASGRKITTGVAIKVGNEVTDICEGDTVYFPRYSANEFNYERALYFSVDSNDIEYVEEDDE